MNQKQIEAAAMHMRLFLVGSSFTFDANFHEFKEVVKRAMFEIELEATKRERKRRTSFGLRGLWQQISDQRLQSCQDNCVFG